MTNIAGQTKDASNESHRLQRGVLTVPNGIALAAAAMAPVLAVVLNAPAAGPVAGAALPLSFLLAFMFIGFDAAATLGEGREIRGGTCRSRSLGHSVRSVSSTCS
jgi:hypothetical protein